MAYLKIFLKNVRKLDFSGNVNFKMNLLSQTMFGILLPSLISLHTFLKNHSNWTSNPSTPERLGLKVTNKWSVLRVSILSLCHALFFSFSQISGIALRWLGFPPVVLLTLFQEPPCLVNTSNLNVSKWTSPLTPIPIQSPPCWPLFILFLSNPQAIQQLHLQSASSISLLRSKTSQCIITVPSLPPFLLLLPLKCALHTPARVSLLRRKLGGIILKSFIPV